MPLALVAVLAGCGGPPASIAPVGAIDEKPPPPRVVTLPGPPGAGPLVAASGEPGSLEGVDTSAMVDRERRIFWRLVSELYAPCADQPVSIAACIEERRPCASCPDAAALLADRVRAGATAAEAQAAYAVRFGPERHTLDAADAPSRGPADAPVTIVVFSDFQCPACKRAMPLLDEAFERLSPSVRLVHKFYPLHHHQHAEGAARSAVAAHRQKKYWEMERLLFDNRDALTSVDLEGYARKLGLDLARFRVDLDAPATTDLLSRHRAEAREAGLDSTPFVLVNGRVFDHAFFSLDRDLVPWLELEIRLARPPSGAADPARP